MVPMFPLREGEHFACGKSERTDDMKEPPRPYQRGGV